MGTLIVCALIGVPFGIGYFVGHARGYNAGARMVLDRLEPSIERIADEYIEHLVNEAEART